jgi:hypothetical protein
VYLDPLARLHVMHVLRNLAGMVSAAFEIPGDHDVVGAAGDAPGILHHVRDAFAEDRVAQGIVPGRETGISVPATVWKVTVFSPAVLVKGSVTPRSPVC